MALYEDNEQHTNEWTCPLCGDTVGRYTHDSLLVAMVEHNANRHTQGHVASNGKLTEYDHIILHVFGCCWYAPPGWPVDRT